MPKLNDKQKKQLLADRADGASIRQLAKKYKCSTTTIQRALKTGDDEVVQLITQKKAQNTKDVIAYMDTKKDVACRLIELYMDEMARPEKIRATPLNQLATAFGIIIDKFTKAGATDANGQLEKLLQGVRQIGSDIHREADGASADVAEGRTKTD